MNRLEENSEIDPKIGNFLRKGFPKPPLAPINEYPRILERIAGRPSFLSELSWFWRLAFPFAALLFALFLYLPRPAVSPIPSVSAENYGGYGVFLAAEKEENMTPGEDWILLAEIVSRP